MKIIQEIHGLIGSAQDIELLSKKDHARILVISDSHNHPGIFASIIKNFGEKCDALVFCGDGAGDFAQTLALADEDKLFKKCLPSVIAIVRGNGDPGSYPVSTTQSISIPNRQVLTVNGHNFMIVHGHNEGVDFTMENLGLEMQIADCAVAFYGHTHIACEEIEGKYKFVNPGSCARPRGGQPACFAIATVEKSFVDIAFIKMEAGSSGATEYKVWNPTY